MMEHPLPDEPLPTLPDGTSPLASIWPDTFARTHPVWGKEVILRTLDNPEVAMITQKVSQQPPELQEQATFILTVAASIVSIDEMTFTDEKGTPLTFEQRAKEVTDWPDPLTALLYARYRATVDEQLLVMAGLTRPN